MKKLIVYLILLTAFSACTKNRDVKVEYLAGGAISEYNLYFLMPDGSRENITVNPESAADTWSYSFMGEQGDIVYISGNYKDPNSALNLIIKLNGKIYKQSSNEGDTLGFLTVSGVVAVE